MHSNNMTDFPFPKYIKHESYYSGLFVTIPQIHSQFHTNTHCGLLFIFYAFDQTRISHHPWVQMWFPQGRSAQSVWSRKKICSCQPRRIYSIPVPPDYLFGFFLPWKRVISHFCPGRILLAVRYLRSTTRGREF